MEAFWFCFCFWFSNNAEVEVQNFCLFSFYTLYRKPNRPLLAPSVLIFYIRLQEQSPSLEDCLKLLKGERDEQRLAGLLLVTKFCKGDDNAALRRVYNAVGIGFLDRLLRTGKSLHPLFGTWENARKRYWPFDCGFSFLASIGNPLMVHLVPKKT